MTKTSNPNVHKAPTVKIVEPPLEVMRARVAAYDAKHGKPAHPSFAEQRLVRELLAYLRPRCRLGNVNVEWFDDDSNYLGRAEVAIPTIRGHEVSTIHLRVGLSLEELARTALHEAGHVHHKHTTPSEQAEQVAEAYEMYWWGDPAIRSIIADA